LRKELRITNDIQTNGKKYEFIEDKEAIKEDIISFHPLINKNNPFILNNKKIMNAFIINTTTDVIGIEISNRQNKSISFLFSKEIK